MDNDNRKVDDCQTAPYFSVYVIWCKITNRFYVGVTSRQVEQRIYEHKHNKGQFIDKEIQALGWEGNFDYWVVEENIPFTFITEREQLWVEYFQALYPLGYNQTIGGIKNFKHSKRTLKHLSRVLRGKPGYWRGKKRPDMTGENHPLYGQHHTQETREKMSKSHTGKKRAPFTEEHKANISKSRTGEKNPNFGKPAWNRGIPCPEATKIKISETLTGRERPDQSERMKGENNPNFGKHLSEETKAKLREKALERDMSGENNPMYGKHHSEEVKAAQSARMTGENNPMYGKSPANKGVPHTPEELAKMSAAQTGEKNGFYGKHHTEESKEKNRQAHLGKPSPRKGCHLSEETKAKLREKALARAAAKRAAKAAEVAADQITP